VTTSSDWTTFLIQTTTGRIGPQIDVDGTTWGIPLNGIESLSTLVKKNSLPKNLDLNYWLSPWWAGILLMWRNVPVFAGPIVSRPLEDFNNIKLDCSGIRILFTDRFVTQEFRDWSGLAKSELFYSDMSLGTIAKRAVQASMNKAGGSLPISFPVPDQFGYGDDADHQRTFEGFNIANLNCDKLLTDLSKVARGPDIMFKPRLLDSSRLMWDFWTGTEGQPRIAQNNLLVWDTDAATGQVADLSVVSTGSYMTNRVFSTGAGTDQGTVITVSENPAPLLQGYPLLESTISISQSPNPDVVKAHGDGVLEANTDMLREITLTVHTNGVYKFGSYWSGDAMDVFTKDWLTFKDGRHRCRLLHMSGDLSTASSIKLNLQPENYNGS
jgi:hypothetical protein